MQNCYGLFIKFCAPLILLCRYLFNHLVFSFGSMLLLYTFITSDDLVLHWFCSTISSCHSVNHCFDSGTGSFYSVMCLLKCPFCDDFCVMFSLCVVFLCSLYPLVCMHVLYALFLYFLSLTLPPIVCFQLNIDFLILKLYRNLAKQVKFFKSYFQTGTIISTSMSAVRYRQH